MTNNRMCSTYFLLPTLGRVSDIPARLRVYLLTACVLVALTSAVCAQGHIKVGAWNIENLGERQLGQDVSALEEIHDTDDSQ